MRCLAPLYVVEKKYQNIGDRKRKVTDMREDMIQITKEMVKIPSINTTEGEKKIGEYIENFIREIPYFKKHPEQVIVRELKNDSLHRRNVIAILLGKRSQTEKHCYFMGTQIRWDSKVMVHWRIMPVTRSS